MGILVTLLFSTIISVADQESILPRTRPKWITTSWSANDPFGSYWKIYADSLERSRNYDPKSNWHERALTSITLLDKQHDPKALYRAAACYIMAWNTDWKFELPPEGQALEPRAAIGALWTKLFRAWEAYAPNLHSREFCRVGFIALGPSKSPMLDADEMLEKLRYTYPKDRLILNSLIWYSRAPGRPNTLRYRTWALDAARQLVKLPNAHPMDFYALGSAYGAYHWVKDDLPTALGYRDAVIEYQKRVPSELARRMDGALKGVNKHIEELKKQGG